MAEQDDSNPTVKRFLTVLDSLTTRMINCELIHLGLVRQTNVICFICNNFFLTG